MNVCLLNDAFPPVIDGVANTVINYAEIITHMDDACAFVATPEYPGADYTSYPYTVIPYKSSDTTAFLNGYRAGNPLAADAINAVKELSPDVIHTHCPASSTIMARVLRKETGAPIIYTHHTKYDIDMAVAVKSKFIVKESMRALVDNVTACDEIWTVSRGAGENLRNLGFEGDYIVMNNGVDFAKGRADDESVKKAVRDYDLPAGLPVFLYVGRIMKYKGLPLIIDALKRLAECGRDFRMVIVGSGKESEEVRAMVTEAGLTRYIRKDDGTVERTDGNFPKGAVIFTGPIYDRNELRGWNTRADLFLFPSTYDTNGIVVREAAACGLASVLIEGSCAAEGITDCRNGYIIREHPGDMFRVLCEVSDNLADAARVGQNAMDEIYISWEDSVKTAYKRYGEVLRMKKSGELDARKKAASDHIIDFTAEVIDKFTEISDTKDELLNDFYENMYGMKENFAEAERQFSEKKENLKLLLRNFEGSVREEIAKAWEKQISVKDLTKHLR